VESVARAGKRGDIHLNRRRILNEVAREPILRIGGREGRLSLDPAPSHPERVDNSSDRMTHWVARVQAVGNGKGVKRTVVSELKHGLTFVKIDFDAAVRYCRGPKQSCAGDAEIVGVWARRAQAVESNKGE